MNILLFIVLVYCAIGLDVFKKINLAFKIATCPQIPHDTVFPDTRTDNGGRFFLSLSS